MTLEQFWKYVRFSELKIVEALKKSLFYDSKLLPHLFNRQEFIAIAKNPFTNALISSYAKEHNSSLPENQAELYSSYIQHRLNACLEKITSRGLTTEQLIECAIDIADAMLKTETLGLEASVHRLQELLPYHPIADVVEILRYARLGRLGSGDERRFSFVHRRFNEYFVVQSIKKTPEDAPKEDIPTD